MMMRLLAIILKSATRITVAPHERNFRDETHPCPLLFWGAGGGGGRNRVGNAKGGNLCDHRSSSG